MDEPFASLDAITRWAMPPESSRGMAETRSAESSTMASAFSMRCAVGLMLILLPGGVPFFQLWRRASSASRLAIEHPVASSSTSRWYIRSEAS